MQIHIANKIVAYFHHVYFFRQADFPPLIMADETAVDGLAVPAEEITFYDVIIEGANAANTFSLKAHHVLSLSQAKEILTRYNLL